MIDKDKYEGHTLTSPIEMDEPDNTGHMEMLCNGGIIGWLKMGNYPSADVNAKLLIDAPRLLLENSVLSAENNYLKLKDEHLRNALEVMRDLIKNMEVPRAQIIVSQLNDILEV